MNVTAVYPSSNYAVVDATDEIGEEGARNGLQEDGVTGTDGDGGYQGTGQNGYHYGGDRGTAQNGYYGGNRGTAQNGHYGGEQGTGQNGYYGGNQSTAQNGYYGGGQGTAQSGYYGGGQGTAQIGYYGGDQGTVQSGGSDNSTSNDVGTTGSGRDETTGTAETTTAEEAVTGEGTADTASEADSGVASASTTDADSTGGGARTLAPGQFEYPPDPALIEKGRAHVESLKAAGLSDERAAGILADEPFLQKIGILLEHGGGGESAASDRARRAIEVLVTDFGTSAGAADRYVSDLALSGAISLEEFADIANDGDFLGKLLPLLDAEAEHPASAEADREMLLRLGGVDVGDGTLATVDENGTLIVAGEETGNGGSTVTTYSPNGVGEPETLDADAQTTAHNVTAGGEPFPEELQQRLDAATAGGGQPDPLLGRVAEILSGAPSTPAEQFLAQVYVRGNITLDDFIGRLDNAEFMEAETTANAAEVFLGTRQDHGPADDFMNTILADGHIDLDTYVAEVNDEGKMGDIAAGARLGELHYRSAGYADLDQLIDGLDLSEEGMKAILHPGVNLAEGPPSLEQIAVFHNLANGNNQKFVELISMWLIENNPGYAIQFGHPTEEAKAAGEPKGFFWTDNGQKVDDPFLNSLLGGLEAGDRNIDDLVPPYLFDDLDENALMHEVRFTFKATNDYADGSSRDHDHDDQTDHTRWLDDLMFPEGKLKDRLKAHAEAGHIPVVLDSVYAERDGTGDAARAAFGAIDPALVDGVQVSWIKDKDGVQVQNASRLQKAVLYVENSRNVDFQGKAGPVEANTFASENVTVTTAAGAQPPPEASDTPLITDTANTGTFRLDPEVDDKSFLDGLVASSMDPGTGQLNPRTEQLVRELSDAPDLAAAIATIEQPPFNALDRDGEPLTPQARSYVYFELLEASRDQAAGRSGTVQQGTTPNGVQDPTAPVDTRTTTGTAHETASGGVENTSVRGDGAGRQGVIEGYVENLVGEAYVAVEQGVLTPEEGFDFVHAELERSRAGTESDGANGIALTDAELAHARAHADELMLGTVETPTDTSVDTLSEQPVDGRANGVSDATSGGEASETETTPTLTEDRRQTLYQEIAVPLHEDIGSDNAYEAVFGDERFANYPEHERAFIVAEVQRLQSGDGSGELTSKSVDGGTDTQSTETTARDTAVETSTHPAETTSNGVWDEYALSAKRQFTETDGGVERFNVQRFYQALDSDTELAAEVGADGVDYIRYQTLEFADNAGILDPADRAAAGLPDPEDDRAVA